MKFLAVLITYAVYRYFVGENRLKRWCNIEPLFRAVNRFGLYIGLVILVILPTLALAFLLTSFSSSLLWLFVSLLILVYHIDMYDYESAIETQILRLKTIDNEAQLADVVETHEEFLVQYVERLFHTFIPILFWFLILGPVAALFYLLLISYLDILEDDDPGVDLLAKVIFFLDVLPVRITCLLFALLGSFSACFDQWLQRFFNFDLSIGEYLLESATLADAELDKTGGDDVRGFILLATSQLTHLLGLWQRTLYAWLGLAALVAIVGF